MNAEISHPSMVPSSLSNVKAQKIQHVSDVVPAPLPPSSSTSDDSIPASCRRKSNKSSRKKSFHSKVVTGCLTCKRRHVKCDETKPSCRKCTRSARQCEGYVVREPWIFEPSWSKSPKPDPQTSLPMSISINQGTQLERRAFEYFSGVTAPMMVQWASKTAQNFWRDFVQSRATSVPAVRHLAVAVASQQNCTAGLESDQSYFASRQYVKALSLLSMAKEAICADTMLLCCSLISVYEHFDPRDASSSSPSHLTAALRILRDPATTWTLATRMFHFMFQQVETVMSVLKNPVVLAREEPSESINKEPPVLPQRFQTSAEIQGKLFEIIRWRFIYSYHHREWSRYCVGFLQLLASMQTWYNLVCNYIASIDEKDPNGEEIQVAIIFKTQFRLWYAALWCSVDKETTKYQHPEQVNLVGLSNPTKLVILVPLRVDPQSRDEDWQPAAHSDRNERRIWPDMEMIRSLRQPAYVRFTLYACRKME